MKKMKKKWNEKNIEIFLKNIKKQKHIWKCTGKRLSNREKSPTSGCAKNIKTKKVRGKSTGKRSRDFVTSGLFRSLTVMRNGPIPLKYYFVRADILLRNVKLKDRLASFRFSWEVPVWSLPHTNKGPTQREEENSLYP